MIETLADWNPWWKEKKVEEDLLGKERGVLKETAGYFQFREIKLLIGIRRSGKSTMFYQLIDSLLKDGIAPEEILLINFEDDILTKTSLKDAFDAYQSNVNPDKKPYLFIDEVHRCNEWVPFLRKLYDLKKVKQVFITDSSSRFIKSEYASILTGRTVTLTVFPLTFKEYLFWKSIKFDSPLSREDINKVRKELLEFLRWGGFPEVFFKNPAAKKKLLTEYFGDIINKDIVERYNVSYVKIKPLADYLVSNTAALFSPRNYSRTYGLSLESIDTYIQYFKEVFLFFFLPKFSYSIKTQQISPKKVYAGDLGFLNNVGFRFSTDLGKIYENAVFIELKRKDREIYYWKNKNECDFIIKEGIKIKNAIQVCLNLTEENKEREINGLTEAMKEFNLKEGTLITEDFETEKRINGKKIKFIPLWKWLGAK